MIDITGADKVKSLFKSKFPGKTVFKIGKYKDGYLAIASETNNDFDDPYYFVKDNNITKFLPMSDFAGVNQAFGRNKIYDNGEG